MPAPQFPIRLFPSPKSWELWIKKQPNAPGVWMRIAKKGGALKSIDYQQALDVALCYGWIDSQKLTHDEDSWLQRFSPRKPRSNWSTTNVRKVELLIKAGKMRAAGLKEVEAAKKDGRWQNAYAGSKEIPTPKEFSDALNKNPKAKAFYATISAGNRYAILFRLHHYKKAETTTRNIKKFITMLEEHRNIHG